MVLVFVFETAFLSLSAHLSSFLRTANHSRLSMYDVNSSYLGLWSSSNIVIIDIITFFEVSDITTVFFEVLQLLFFCYTHRIWKFSCQGFSWSHSCDLLHSCSNTGSLTHCAVPGIKSVSQGSSKAINPTEPQWELPAHFLHLILAKRLRSNPCPFFNKGFLGGEGGCWVVWAFCVFWVFTPYLDTSFTNIYTHSGGGLYLCCMKAFNFFVICLY